MAKQKRARRSHDKVLRIPPVEGANSKKLRAWSLTEAELAQLTEAVNKLK